MIALQVENYCQECPKFEPECTKYYYGIDNCTTLISCTNSGLCANLKLYIEQQAIKRERPDYMTTCVNKWEDAKDDKEGSRGNT